jgi:hypothetical protein
MVTSIGLSKSKLSPVGSPVIDPFCIVDMGLKSGDELTVKVNKFQTTKT